ncbi:facilitated trehalose transporter Tret1 [Halyomorpha halys]|uniref:facilitated trehalose transporter Tret1 n=1 Tax=Halyomorpha halys TaxID=286706 RepID=UPI0006D52941|nr:facilitated trehalose transporter Tret1-like [Halyomorpha halys]
MDVDPYLKESGFVTIPLGDCELVSNEKTDDSEKKEDDQKVSTIRRLIPQLLAVTAKNTLALNFGLSIGFPTILIPDLKSPDSSIKLTTEQLSWLGSLFFIIIPFGCLLSGPMIHKFGRRRVMIILCIPFCFAWWIFHAAESPTVLFLAVTMHGLVNGLLEAPILTYVAEVCEARWRGTLASTSVLSSLLGVSLQFLLGTLLPWRQAALLNIAFPILSFVSLLFVPESPHWLAAMGREKDAEKALQWLRGWTTPKNVKEELDELMMTLHGPKKQASPFTWAPYLNRAFLRPFGLVVASFFIGHFTGMSTLQTYAIVIFDAMESPVDSHVATTVEGFIQLSGALLCVLILPHTGRRKLAILCTTGTGICLAGLVFSTNGWLSMLLLLLAVFLLNTCSKVFPWVLIGEVFGPDVRAVASGIASCIGYAMGFLVNKTFFQSVDLLTLRGVFGLYAALSIGGAILYYFTLPETEGRSLEEVQQHFKGESNLVKNTKKGQVNVAFERENP